MKQRNPFAKLKRAAKVGPSVAYHFVRQNLRLVSKPELFYAVPGKEWVTDWVGRYITKEITSQFGWGSQVISTPQLLRGQIIHYGEMGAFLHYAAARHNKRNKVVTTIFHGDRNPQFPELAQRVNKFIENAQIAARVLTACRIMEARLINWGLPAGKVLCIPLGVDLDHFQPSSGKERQEKRRKLGIPEDAICIGSFQKDGVGWDEGLEPKMVKGPDVFLETIKRLAPQHKLFVLLTGPARGYIKQGLEAIGVPYYHQVVQNYLDIRDFYACLDLYLVASREEGGPKAVLESLAMGVPLVTTRVGLAPDVIKHGHNGMLANIEDVAALAAFSQQIINDRDLRDQLVSNGLEDIQSYSWQKIAARYYHELYQPLLQEMAKKDD